MYQALHAASRSLREFLRTQILADAFLGAGPSPWMTRSMDVTLNTPTEMAVNGTEGVSLWLYRVVRDGDTLNLPPRRIGLSQLEAPPLPLRLHYLITPITSRDNKGDPDTEQYVLGKVLQVFHTWPVLRGADLRDELTGTDTQLQVRLETLDLDAISRVWEALEGSYQLSVSYEVGVVTIDSALEPQGIAPVQSVLPEIGLIVG